uniref:NADH-ubiquinone oxidoreductase chain 2 n=1 Tax=Lentinula edodes TaxID=5353 RepID=I7HBM6_LENED|nr:NADH dehydrogenase subunit 2 [Lentinula edodes]QEN73904.1 NADH dehydrogenase subunit 2 [Lentinula edodes]UZS77545.1 NADH dehydrogenase subunit 2 [Lentinula edodes]UZS77571.1 NADH dehydrogenase subunit 2 [Lentinula edodes]UZS77594.1 NADH dehydrogenase subunit 2 [Lentinula edodes]UZS77620.1 NADH dehydrogenase subunit 2 [Lentinula edodes]
MLFITLITLIICKALLSERLTLNFSYRITSIILLLTAILNYNTLLNFDIVTGIGIYNGLFHITYITQIIEIFLLIIGSIILISWPFKNELITEISLSSSSPLPNTNQPEQSSFSQGKEGKVIVNDKVEKKYPLLYSISLENYFNQSLIEGSKAKELLYNHGNHNNLNIKYSLLSSGRLEQNNHNFINYGMNYSIIVLFCTLGASLLISCSDLISMYLSIELQSFSLYVLSTLYKNSELSTSAGLKYFLLGGLSSCLILFGAGLIYAYTGLTNFESIYSFLSIYSIEINNNLLQIIYPFLSEEYSSSIFLGFIFIFVGFLFKIAAAPFHNWSPDVYDETPTIVTIWLTLIPKISILILLLELHIHIDLINQLSLFGQLKIFSFNIDTITKNLLLISSLFSLIIGSVVGLAQNRIKRLLAYSTISHIGYILLALGIYTEQSIDSFIFYIIQYIITNLNIFLIIIALSYIINKSINNDKTYFKDIRYISEFKGLFYSNPLISLSFSICLFSIAGIPPLIGFFSKQFVLYSAIQSGYNFIAIVAIFVSVISASYYLKIIKTFFIDFDSKELNNNLLQNSSTSTSLSTNVTTSLPASAYVGLSASNEGILNNSHSFLISTLTLSILFFIFKPSLILNITQLLSLSLFYI